MHEELGKQPGLDHARKIRVVLAEAARRAKLSTKRRRAYDVGTLSQRRGAQLWSLAVRGSFVLLCVIPSLVGTVYFALIASPQYVTDAKFTVQGGEALRLEGVGMLTGLPSLAAVQNTQIVTHYVKSRAMVEGLLELLDVRKMYGSEKIDYVSQFNVKKPIEKLVDYWQGKIATSIELPGGIVTVAVRAFSPEASLDLGKAVLTLSEKLVNGINQRIWQDNIRSAERDFEAASNRLADVRRRMEQMRNSEGILDASKTGSSLIGIIAELTKEKLRLEQQYDTQIRWVSPSALQMQLLKARIEIVASQVHEIEASMTAQRSGNANGTKVLSDSMKRFSEVELESRIAERLFASTASALALARAGAERQYIYLKVFTKPALAEDSIYPKRALSIVVICCGSFVLWATLAGLGSAIRNHMA